MNANETIEKAEEFEGDAQETIQGLKNRVLEWQRIARENTVKAAHATDNYVHDNPWTVIASVGIAAFAIGFLLGNRRHGVVVRRLLESLVEQPDELRQQRCGCTRGNRQGHVRPDRVNRERLPGFIDAEGEPLLEQRHHHLGHTQLGIR